MTLPLASLLLLSLATYASAQWHQVNSTYQVLGGYFDLRENYTNQHGAQHNTCYQLARTFDEPVTTRFSPRRGLSFPDFPRLAWRWDGAIQREQFTYALTLKFGGDVDEVVHYKLISGTLYVGKGTKQISWFREHAEEMLKVAVFLFPDLPDMEFLLYFGDGCLSNAPVLQWNICRDQSNAGFAIPTFTVWSRAMGRTQMAAYHACLEGRYPANNRIPKVVWRGSTTGAVPGPVNVSNCMKLPRVQLHQLAQQHPQLLDVGLHKLLQACEATLKPVVTDLLESIAEEDYNKYCVILDVDGNGWSNRFVSTLVHYPTPVLKQASNATGAFEELYAPGVAIEHFAPDLSDLLQRAAELVEDCRAQQAAAANGSSSNSSSRAAGGGAGRGRLLAATMQAASRRLLDHVGIAEGTAYLLSVYANLTSWPLDRSTEGFLALDMQCCRFAQLPAALQEEIEHWATTREHRKARGAGVRVEAAGRPYSGLVLYGVIGCNILTGVGLFLYMKHRMTGL